MNLPVDQPVDQPVENIRQRFLAQRNANMENIDDHDHDHHDSVVNFKLRENKDFNLKDFIKDHLSCGICAQIMHNPVTLLCQHTFCRVCLMELQKSEEKRQNIYHMPEIYNNNQIIAKKHHCPVCNTRFFLPPRKMNNFVLKNMIESMIDDPDYFKAREKRALERDPELIEEVKKQLERDLLSQVLDNLNLIDKTKSEQLYQNNPNPIGLHRDIYGNYKFPCLPDCSCQECISFSDKNHDSEKEKEKINRILKFGSIMIIGLSSLFILHEFSR